MRVQAHNNTFRKNYNDILFLVEEIPLCFSVLQLVTSHRTTYTHANVVFLNSANNQSLSSGNN